MFARVTIHSSQFPDQVRRDLLESLRSRQVNHKFHYDSVKQAQQWFALHEAYSPSRTDAHCVATYDRSFDAAAKRLASNRIHLIGLGCGGGQKDARLLKLLGDSGKDVWYSPCDVSTAMVLTARQAALQFIEEERCCPLVCDLATADDLAVVLDKIAEQWTSPFSGIAHDALRLVTFFGMLPNFEPEVALPRLGALVRSRDTLLLSANLAPGPDYVAGAQRILPLYDNELTRDWLLTFLLDLGFQWTDGELRFHLEEHEGLQRVAAHFHFLTQREIRIDSDRFAFRSGDSIRLFFSYRHTPDWVRSLLEPHGLQVVNQWITESEEEGVFLVKRVQ